jgi:hypothetical protein
MRSYIAAAILGLGRSILRTMKLLQILMNCKQAQSSMANPYLTQRMALLIASAFPTQQHRQEAETYISRFPVPQVTAGSGLAREAECRVPKCSLSTRLPVEPT